MTLIASRTCSVPECARPAFIGGMCRLHYRRLQTARKAAVAPGAWRLEGYDTFSGEEYELGSAHDGLKPSYPTYGEALADAHRRLEYLERTQPSRSSGGQASGGIQDRVYIVHPDGRKERVFPVTAPDGSRS